MGGVRFYLIELASARLVEPPHQAGVGPPCFGCGHVFQTMIFPESTVIPEGPNARFSRYPCSRQHHNTFSLHNGGASSTLFEIHKNDSCQPNFTKSDDVLASKFSHPDQSRGPEALEDFDEPLGLELGIEVVVARIDSNRFQTDEFRRGGNAQDVAVTDDAEHVG